jgi:hypothetical protein
MQQMHIINCRMEKGLALPLVYTSLLLLQLCGLGLVTYPNSELLQKLCITSTIGRTPWTRKQPDARPLSTQNSTTRKKNIHAVSGIRTHDLSVQAIKAYISDRAAAGTGHQALRLTFYSSNHRTISTTFRTVGPHQNIMSEFYYGP